MRPVINNIEDIYQYIDLEEIYFLFFYIFLVYKKTSGYSSYHHHSYVKVFISVSAQEQWPFNYKRGSHFLLDLISELALLTLPTLGSLLYRLLSQTLQYLNSSL